MPEYNRTRNRTRDLTADYAGKLILAHLQAIDSHRTALESEVRKLARLTDECAAAADLVRRWMDAGGVLAADFEAWLKRRRRTLNSVRRVRAVRLVVNNSSASTGHQIGG